MLKLLAALFNGRHCIVNSPMVENTGLENLCSIKNTASEMIEEINRLIQLPFDTVQKTLRAAILLENFSNAKNIQKLIALI